MAFPEKSGQEISWFYGSRRFTAVLSKAATGPYPKPLNSVHAFVNRMMRIFGRKRLIFL
jgi:hypothetical protein